MKLLSKQVVGLPENYVTEKVRIYSLQTGDFFKMLNRIYRVSKRTEDRIYYWSVYVKNNYGGHRDSFGVRCQAKVLLITEKT